MDNAIKNRYDFVLIFDVKDGNPNGDPDAGNLPRIDPETGHGIVTDVCLKRKVRNYVAMTKEYQRPYDIYIREKAVLGQAHFKAFSELQINTGQESRKTVPPELVEEFSEIAFPEGMDFIEGEDDNSAQIIIFATADKKEITSWLKEEKLPKKIDALIKAALKEAKPRKPSAGEVEQGRQKMCQDHFDIRTFGAVMSLKSAPNCGQVRGPVQMTFGRSVDPVVTLEYSITRMAVATEAEAEKQSGDNRTMGRKNTVPYGLYVSHGFVSAHLAAQTGFNREDLELLWGALVNMFEHDRSAARGEMNTRKLIVFEHGSPLGVAPAHSLFECLTVTRKNPAEPPRAYADYTVSVDKAKIPEGVTVYEKP